MFNIKKDIEYWLKVNGVKNYTINEDMSVDVDGNVSLSKLDIFEFPVKFRNVSGYFWCNDNKLTTLIGCPVSVGGDFKCIRNELTNLDVRGLVVILTVVRMY